MFQRLVIITIGKSRCISIGNVKIKPSRNLGLGVKNQVRRSLLAEDSTSDEINCCHLELIDDDDDEYDDDDDDDGNEYDGDDSDGDKYNDEYDGDGDQNYV